MLDRRQWRMIDWTTLRVPRLIVLVDAEEEFDWHQPFSRANHSVSNMAHQVRAHRLFERWGVVPTYMVDYPVVSQPEGFQPLAELIRDGKCRIGAQLHPWVTPPFSEAVTVRNSFAGNLPPQLERAKLQNLTHAIQDNLGVSPIAFTAGRYGVGPATADILRELGYRIDSSVRPHSEYTAEGGPDFRHCSSRPYWVGADRRLLELPRTVGLTGQLAWSGTALFDLLQSPLGRRLRLPGIFARTGLIERVALTPEGTSYAEQRRVTDAMLRAGHRIFVLSYHSPSLVPGHTPYVATDSDLAAFLDRIERYCDFFFGEVGGAPATPEEVLDLALGLTARDGATSPAPAPTPAPDSSP